MFSIYNKGFKKTKHATYSYDKNREYQHRYIHKKDREYFEGGVCLPNTEHCKEFKRYLDSINQSDLKTIACVKIKNFVGDKHMLYNDDNVCYYIKLIDIYDNEYNITRVKFEEILESKVVLHDLY